MFLIKRRFLTCFLCKIRYSVFQNPSTTPQPPGLTPLNTVCHLVNASMSSGNSDEIPRLD